MKLNIVTGSSNSLGAMFLKECAKVPEDVTIGMSRKGNLLYGTYDFHIDLLDRAQIKRQLLSVFGIIDMHDISEVHLIHTASKIKNEFNDLADARYRTDDSDGDGIDDDVFHSTYTTLENTCEELFACLQSHEKESIPKYLNIICSLVDKKPWEPSSHKSMVRTNKLMRKYIQEKCEVDASCAGVCMSVGTIATASEVAYRKFGDQKYWLSEEEVVRSVLEHNRLFSNSYTDVDLYAPHPQYNQYFKNETDVQMTERFKREIGII